MKNSNRVREFLWGYNFIPLSKRNWNICLFLTCLYWRAESCSLGGQEELMQVSWTEIRTWLWERPGKLSWHSAQLCPAKWRTAAEKHCFSLRCSSRSLLPKSKYPVKVNAITPISSFIGNKLCKFWWRIEWSCTLHKHVSLKSKTFCFRKKYI